MYKKLLIKQFEIDFNCDSELLQESFFLTSTSNSDARYWDRNKADIVCFNNKIFVRTEIEALTKELEKLYGNINAEWFLEMNHIYKLNHTLKKYQLKIERIAPFFIPNKVINSEEIPLTFQRFNQEDIFNFKQNKQITESFCYSEHDPDQIGFGYYVDNTLIAICGANKNGKYTWEIGIEILDRNFNKKGIATMLVKTLISTIQKEQPNIIPVYSTSLSHTNSMNVAINAGCRVGWSEIIISEI
ncbi:MAG: GNAT family N-acetyltransferase [Vagococcus sp.]|uniref:GNAT family N-acetyltransferase n=1 Tax=Vagococcus sp. TaxID=1933889 RepID=UPI002FC61865